jgi:hypothetical protein
MEADYNDFEVFDPVERLLSLQNGEIVGTQACENRQCDTIEFTEDKNTYRMTVRKVLALPFKVTKILTEDTEEVVTYSDAAFDHLKEEDMTIPDHFEMVE